MIFHISRRKIKNSYSQKLSSSFGTWLVDARWYETFPSCVSFYTEPREREMASNLSTLIIISEQKENVDDGNIKLGPELVELEMTHKIIRNKEITGSCSYPITLADKNFDGSSRWWTRDQAVTQSYPELYYIVVLCTTPQKTWWILSVITSYRVRRHFRCWLRRSYSRWRTCPVYGRRWYCAQRSRPFRCKWRPKCPFPAPSKPIAPLIKLKIQIWKCWQFGSWIKLCYFGIHSA